MAPSIGVSRNYRAKRQETKGTQLEKTTGRLFVSRTVVQRFLGNVSAEHREQLRRRCLYRFHSQPNKREMLQGSSSSSPACAFGSNRKKAFEWIAETIAKFRHWLEKNIVIQYFVTTERRLNNKLMYNWHETNIGYNLLYRKNQNTSKKWLFHLRNE